MSRKVGITSGVFDLFHVYHLNYLQRCAEHCDHLVVFVDSDRLAFEQKGRLPIINQNNRAEIIRALECVGTVWIMDNLSGFEKFVTEKADIVFKNATKIYGTELIGKEKTKIIPDIQGYSTTDIKNRIINGTKL